MRSERVIRKSMRKSMRKSTRKSVRKKVAIKKTMRRGAVRKKTMRKTTRKKSIQKKNKRYKRSSKRRKMINKQMGGAGDAARYARQDAERLTKVKDYAARLKQEEEEKKLRIRDQEREQEMEMLMMAKSLYNWVMNTEDFTDIRISCTGSEWHEHWDRGAQRLEEYRRYIIRLEWGGEGNVGAISFPVRWSELTVKANEIKRDWAKKTHRGSGDFLITKKAHDLTESTKEKLYSLDVTWGDHPDNVAVRQKKINDWLNWICTQIKALRDLVYQEGKKDTNGVLVFRDLSLPDKGRIRVIFHILGIFFPNTEMENFWFTLNEKAEKEAAGETWVVEEGSHLPAMQMMERLLEAEASVTETGDDREAEALVTETGEGGDPEPEE